MAGQAANSLTLGATRPEPRDANANGALEPSRKLLRLMCPILRRTGRVVICVHCDGARKCPERKSGIAMSTSGME